MARQRIIFAALVGLLILSCIAKKTLWKGQYVTLYVANPPREDFKAGHYIVVAYSPVESDKKSEVLYRFEAMQYDAVVRALECMDTEKYPGLLFGLEPKGKDSVGVSRLGGYWLVEAPRKQREKYSRARLVRANTVHQAYGGKPDYEQVKADVIILLENE